MYMSLICHFVFLFILTGYVSIRNLQVNCANYSLCRIQGSVAVCSGYGKNLTYIPYVPQNITVLKFNFNFLPNVSLYTFTNITELKLKTLHIVGDHIKLITRHAFSSLKYLKYLDISHNTIHPDIIAHAFFGLGKIPVQRLDMLAVGLHYIPKGFFDNLKNSKINNIHMHQNYLQVFNCSDFDQLKFLYHLGLGQNLITKLLFTSSCHLKELDASYNSIKDVCQNGTFSTSLQLLDVQFNGIYHVDPSTFACFPNLHNLFIGGNYISRLPTNTFSHMNELTVLSMINNPKLFIIEAGAFNNSKLTTLLLKNCAEYFSGYDWDMFRGNNLIYLDISQNNLNQIPPTALQRLFEPLRNSLKELLISDSSLSTIPSFISNMPKLNRLILNNNLISRWSAGTLSSLTLLQYLDLSRNEITIVAEDSVPPNILNSVTFNFYGNPFDCSCANIWFLKTFKAHLDTFDCSGKLCQCSNTDGMEGVYVRDVPLSEISCLLNLTSQLILIASSSVLLLVFIIIILSNKYKWQLRYLLYMYNNGNREQKENDDQYQYDVFVVYSSEDSNWVLDVLVPKLEDEFGFKLCIHERNFVAGKLIVDNIISSIDSSKKIMVVLSNAFSQKDWCQFELSVIHQHILEKGQNLLVVVVLEQLNYRLLSPTMYTMLQTTTYIKWPDDALAEDMFWNNLVPALH